MTTLRVRYTEQQILQAADLNAEQAYRLAARQRHLLAAHGWGILHGLRIQLGPAGFVVQPGYAIDGFGRELIVQRPLFSAWDSETNRLFEEHAMIAVWLIAVPVAPTSLPGWRACQPAPEQRQLLDPQLFLTILRTTPGQTQPEYPDPQAPVCVPPDLLGVQPHAMLPEDLPTWPVYLGRIGSMFNQEHKRHELMLDPHGRPYAGLVGASLISASRVAVTEQPGKLAERSPEPVPRTTLTARRASAHQRISATLADNAGSRTTALTCDSLAGVGLHATTRLIGVHTHPADLLLTPVDLRVHEADLANPEALANQIDYLNSLLARPAPEPGLPGEPGGVPVAPVTTGQPASLFVSTPTLRNTQEIVQQLNRWIVDPRLLNHAMVLNLPLRQITRELLKAPETSQQQLLARRSLLADLFPDQFRATVPVPTAHGVALQPAPGPTKAAAPWRMYCVEVERAGKRVRQFRIEIGVSDDKEHPERNQCVVGHWSQAAKQFQPCLTVDQDCTVHVSGNLTVAGDVIKGTPPAGPGTRSMLEQLADQWQQGVAAGMREQSSLIMTIQSLNSAKAGSPWPYTVQLKNTGTTAINYLSIIEQVAIDGSFASHTAATIASLPGQSESTQTISHSDPNLPVPTRVGGTVTVMLTVVGFTPDFKAIYVSKGQIAGIVA